MDVRLLANREASSTILKLVDSCDQFAFCVAWAGKNRIADRLRRSIARAKWGVVGTHMYQTSPEVLRNFIGKRSVRYMPPTGGLFHPKIYAFWRGSSMTVIVGSHNLTAGAFDGNNVEASLMCSGASTDPVMVDIEQFIERAWSEANEIADDDFLLTYSRLYEVNKGKRNALKSCQLVRRPKGGDIASPLDLQWKSFVHGVRSDKHHSKDGRIRILEKARTLFARHSSFERMSLDERKAIAGTYGKNQPQLDGLDWAWFGTMFGQGDFKNLVIESPELLSRALDRIPLLGEPTEAQYQKFAADFQRAFESKTHKGGIATASRLLAMKRPDWFVALNKANKVGLCKSLGVAPTTLGIENYWGSVVVPITMSAWWNHPRPNTREEASIWDNRAALLDSLYYDPV